MYTNKILHLLILDIKVPCKKLFEKRFLLLKIIFRNTDLINWGESQPSQMGSHSRRERQTCIACVWWVKYKASSFTTCYLQSPQ